MPDSSSYRTFNICNTGIRNTSQLGDRSFAAENVSGKSLGGSTWPSHAITTSGTTYARYSSSIDSIALPLLITLRSQTLRYATTLQFYTATTLQHKPTQRHTPPIPHRMRILQLDTPPQHLLSLLNLPALLIRPRKRKPRLRVVPPSTQLRQRRKQSVGAVARSEAAQFGWREVVLGGGDVRHKMVFLWR